MCGIIGTLTFNKNGFFLRDVEVFKELLIVNSIRGSHSTGVFGGTLTSEMDFAKVVGNPYDFINNKQTEPIFNNMLNKYRLMVGHGRQATRGSITGEFAHPFQKDHITMVHNGTVNNSSLIDVTKYVSDSKAICEALSKNNEQEVFQDINGAYAIAYHNSKKETFSLVRNKERPLALGIDENNNRIYFSSEINLLETILLRNSIAGVVLSSIPENTIFTFNTKGGINYTETKTKPPVTLVQVPTSYTQSYNSSSNARVVSITSHSTGEKIKLGDKVIFSISDIHELRSDNKNDDKFFQVFGYIPSFPEIETSVLYLGKEEELYENTN
ncbi:MAG: hypothetical protein RBT52_02885, partial [Sulfurimonas sp.]|nr:hypothetical protein [Sulfurimonas sp.]